MNEISFTGVDAVFVIVVLVSAGYAAYRGLMRETLSVFAWALAAFCALRFYLSGATLLYGSIEPEWLAEATSFVGIFLIVLIPLSFMGYRFAQTVQRSEIGPVDRTLGFVFGVGRGLVIAGFAYIAFSLFVPLRDHPDWLTRARTLPLIQNTADVLLSLVPEEAYDRAAARNLAPQPRGTPGKNSSETTPQETYGADERRALDRLIESTGER